MYINIMLIISINNPLDIKMNKMYRESDSGTFEGVYYVNFNIFEIKNISDMYCTYTTVVFWFVAAWVTGLFVPNHFLGPLIKDL